MEKKTSLHQAVLQGSVVTIILSLFGSGLAYLVRIFYSRTLTVEDYGLFYAVFAFVSLISVYVDLGFGYATAYLLPKYIKLKNYAVSWNIIVYGQVIALLVAAASTLVLAATAGFLAKSYFKVPGSENLVYLFSIYIITYILLNGLTQIFSGLQRPKYYSSISVLKWLLTFTFSILFFFYDTHNVVYYALSWSLGHLLTAVVFILILFHHYPQLTKNKVTWQLGIFKQMLVLAWPSLLTTLTYSLVLFTDSFFLTLFQGVREVGIYNIIYPVATISLITLSPLTNLVLPLVSHLAEGEVNKVGYLVNKILQIVPFVGVYFALFIILFPSSFAQVFFGFKWLGLIETPLRLLSLGLILLPLSNLLETILLGLGRIKQRMKILLLITGIKIILSSILVWQYGVYGAVITSSFVTLLSVAFFIALLKTEVVIRIPYLFYLKLITVSVVIFIAVTIVNVSPQNLFSFIGAGIIYSLIFLLTGYWLTIYDKETFRQLSSLLVKIKDLKF